MAYARERDFLFCDLCGTMLIYNQRSCVECSLCKFKRNAKEVRSREISYRVSAEDVRRELGISTFDAGVVELPKVNKKCEKCDNNELQYYTRQMRSADEGATTFYTCTKCRHQFTEN